MPNEYSDLAREMFGTNVDVSPDNPYVPAAKELANNERIGLRASATTAVDLDPERHGKVLALARKTKLPPSLVADQFDMLSKHTRISDADLDGIHREHPKLGTWLSDRDNAAIAQDDLPVLRSLDYAIRSLTAPDDDPNGILPKGFCFDSHGEIIEPLGYGYANRYKTADDLIKELNRRAEAEGIDEAERIDRANKLREQFGPLANVVAGAGSSAASTLSFLSVNQDRQADADRFSADITSASQQLSPGFLGDLQRGLGGLIADVPLMLTGGPVAKGAQSLLKISRGRAVLSQTIGKTAAKTAADAATVAAAVQPLAVREGVLTGRESGAGNGLMAWAIETAVPSAFGRTGVERALVGEHAEVARLLGKNLGAEGWAPVARRLAVESGFEAVEEATTELAHALHEVASGIDPHALDQDRLLKRLAVAGVLGGVAGGGFNLPSVIAEKFYRDALRAERAERDASLLAAAGKAIEDSATGKRSAERLQDLVKAAGGDSAIYFNQDEWVQHWESQGASPEGIAQSLGVDPTTYQAAVSSGGQIAVPLSNYLAKVGPTEHFQALHKKSRLRADGMSLEEAEQWKKEAPKFLEDVQAVSEPTEVDDAVIADAVEQLVAAGYSPQAAEDSASTLGFFTVLANRWNKDAEARGAKPIDAVELFQSYGLKIQREGKEQSEQPVQEAAQEFGQERFPASGLLLNRVQSLLARREAVRKGEYGKTVDKQAETERIARKPAEFGQGEFDESAKGRDAGRRGSIRIAVDRKVTITLSEKADPSTFLHEVFHFNLEVLGDLAERDGAPQDIKDDYQAVLDWMGVTSRSEIKREHHEQWARAGEAYIMEGKAPSSALRRVFARLSQWIASIYKSLRALNVNLTPEVRGVMDRLLASEEEIAAAEREEVGSPLFLDAKTAGMSEAQFEAYAKGIEKVAMMARENLRAEIMDELKREERAWWKAERQRITEEVTKRVNEQKDYIAIAAMTKGTLPDGSPLPDAIKAVKLNKKALTDDFGAEFLKRLPRGITSKDGVLPEQAAELFGYRSGQELVMAIANAKPKAQHIAEEVEAQLLQEHGDMRFDGRAVAKAEEAIHGSERAKLLMLELEALHKLQRTAKPIVKQADKADREQAKAVVQSIPPIEIFRDVAAKTIAAMKVRDINPKLYLRAARKASKEAFEALGKKDYGLAASLKQKELLNNELFVEASKAKTEIDKIVKAMRRFLQDGTRARIGKAGEDYLELIDDLMARYEFVPMSGRKLDMRNRMAAFIQKIEAEGRPHAIPQDVIDDARAINYQELPFEFLVALRDTAKAIQHLATSKNKALKQRADEDFDVTIGNAAHQIGKNVPPRPPEKKGGNEESGWANLWSRIEGFAAAHRKLSSYARQMDGGKSGGLMWQLLVRGLNEAADTEVEGRKAAAKTQQGLWKAWKESGAKLTDKAVIPGVGEMSREKRIMVGLNFGNEGNRERLRNDFNEPEIQAILNSLEEADWTLIKGIWSHIDSYWPEIAAKQKRVTGLAPEKIEAAPFLTKFGEMPGGYFPIVYDRNRSAKQFGDQKQVEKLYELGAATAATTRRGHTKERTANAGAPLLLSLDVIPRHLSQVIHDLTHHEAIIDMNRLLGDETLATTIQNHLGPKALREMRKIVHDIALSDLAENDVDRALRYVRNGVSVATLGFSFSTAVIQLTGFTQSMQLVGVGNYLKAVARIFSDVGKTESRFDWIRRKSSFMANRSTTVIREASEVINQVKNGQVSAWRERLNQWAYYMTIKAQLTVDMPTWLAAYESALAAGKDEDTAVAIADQAVKDTQGSGLAVDLAGVQRSRVSQLFTVFYSYWNTTFNRSAEAIAAAKRNHWSPEAILRLGSDYLLLFAIPSALTALVRRFFRDDEDRDKNFGAEMAKEQLAALMSTMVGVREVADPLAKLAVSTAMRVAGVDKRDIPKSVSQNFGYQGPAGTMGFEAISDLIIQMKQGELDEGLTKAAGRAAGVWLHLPATQVIRTVDGFMYLEDHRSMDPRPLLFGAPRN